MEKYLGRFTPQLFAILRIFAGVMFAMHGTQKLFGWPGDKGPTEMPIMKFAGGIELVAGILIAIGFLAGWASFFASGLMAVAYFKAHAPDGAFPIVNDGELAVLYCFVFLYIAAHGAGAWSVDGARRR